MKQKYISYILIGLFIVLLMNGCNQNSIVIPSSESQSNQVHNTIDEAIISLANQLSLNNKLSPGDKGTITIVSFVDLQNFDSTSPLGRILAESLYSELFVRGFNISDIRGQNAININNKGEFYITRDLTKLHAEVANTYILVGTYSKIEQNIIINTRVMDNRTGKVLSSARALYSNDDCTIFGVCNNNSSRKIKIVPNGYENPKNMLKDKQKPEINKS